MSNQYARIIIDESVPVGGFQIGGARIVQCANDEDLGRELRTAEVRVHDEAAAQSIRDELVAIGLTLVE